MTKTALIDADSLIFYSSKETIEDSILSMKDRISSILNKTNSNQFILFLTGSKNQCFRYELYPEYKNGRKKSRKKYGQKLKYLKTLKAFLIEEYNACLISSLEADDLVVYYSANLKDTETVISSPDKDVLYQTVGTHYNYGKDEFVTVATQNEADRFLAFQLLIGDVSDSIPGLSEKTKYMKEKFGLDNRAGVGEATAIKILNIIDEKYNGNYAKEIAECYISKYNTSEEEGTAIEQGLADYNMNRYLLTLEVNIGRYNKILAEYDIESHLNVLSINEQENEIEDF